MSSHYHIYIFKCLFTSRDDQFENLGEASVLACEMFTPGFRRWIKTVACLSSLIFRRIGESFKEFFLEVDFEKWFSLAILLFA